MKLGIWSNSEDATTNYICEKKPDWLDIIRFDSDIPFPITIGKRSGLLLSDIDILWHRRPFENAYILDTIGDKIAFSESEEALWNYLMQIPKYKWLNFPTINWMADKKISQLIHAEECGLVTPEWILTNNENEAREFLGKYSWNCIIKPVNCGYFINENKVYHIYTNETIAERVDLSLISKCPTYFQTKISKQYDVRSVYLNGKAIYIGIYGGLLDVRRNEMKGVQYKLIIPPKQICESYERLMLREELNFCTSDFIVTEDNKWIFLENNPNGQWVWMDECLNGAIVDFFYNNLRLTHE